MGLSSLKDGLEPLVRISLSLLLFFFLPFFLPTAPSLRWMDRSFSPLFLSSSFSRTSASLTHLHRVFALRENDRSLNRRSTSRLSRSYPRGNDRTQQIVRKNRAFFYMYGTIERKMERSFRDRQLRRQRSAGSSFDISNYQPLSSFAKPKSSRPCSLRGQSNCYNAACLSTITKVNTFHAPYFSATWNYALITSWSVLWTTNKLEVVIIVMEEFTKRSDMKSERYRVTRFDEKIYSETCHFLLVSSTLSFAYSLLDRDWVIAVTNVPLYNNEKFA